MRALANDQRINAQRYAWVGARNGSPSVQQVNGAVVREQLANNPRFTSTSGTVEVRRNLFNNPDAVSLAYFGTANGATPTLTGDGSGILITCFPNGIADSGARFTGLPTVVGSTAYTLSVEVEAVTDCTLKASIQGTGFPSPSIEWIAFSAGEVKRMNRTVTSLAAGGSASPYILRQNASGSEKFKVRKVMWEAAPTAMPFFSGSYSPDPDLSPVWVGTENASQSYLRGFVPRNTSTINNSAVASYYGVRLIPNNAASADSNVYAGGSSSSLSGNGVTFTPGKWYGIQAVCTLLAPQTGTLGNSSRRIQLAFNNVSGWKGVNSASSIQPPNEAGSYQEEIVTQLPADSVWAGLRLYNGASFGNGDVYWDKLLIVEGDTEAEVRDKLALGYFDGDTRVDATTINRVTNL